MKRPFHVGCVMLSLLALVACSNEPAKTADDQPETTVTQPTTASVETPRAAAPRQSEPALNGTHSEGELVAPAHGSAADERPIPDNKAATPGSQRNDADATSPVVPPPAAPGAAPDNTRVNKRDANSAALTPVDQGNGDIDLRITQQIRQAVMADNSLSFTAKNVKIITLNGSVTLRGPVNTAAERSAIEAAARRVAGAQVDNQIEVKK